MATIDEIKQQAAAVKNATQVGENTAERVGGALAGLAEIAEQHDSKLSGLYTKFTNTLTDTTQSGSAKWAFIDKVPNASIYARLNGSYTIAEIFNGGKSTGYKLTNEFLKIDLSKYDKKCTMYLSSDTVNTVTLEYFYESDLANYINQVDEKLKETSSKHSVDISEIYNRIKQPTTTDEDFNNSFLYAYIETDYTFKGSRELRFYVSAYGNMNIQLADTGNPTELIGYTEVKLRGGLRKHVYKVSSDLGSAEIVLYGDFQKFSELARPNSNYKSVLCTERYKCFDYITDKANFLDALCASTNTLTDTTQSGSAKWAFSRKIPHVSMYARLIGDYKIAEIYNGATRTYINLADNYQKVDLSKYNTNCSLYLASDTENTVTLEYFYESDLANYVSEVDEKRGKEIAGLKQKIDYNHGNYNLMKHIAVKKDGTGDFKDIQEAINSIKDASPENQYDIQIYDDFEVNDLNMLYKNDGSKNTESNPSVMVAFIWTKSWVHLRGMGFQRKINVVNPNIDMEGASFQNVHNIFVKGNVIINNLYFGIKGGRYAIHQDCSSDGLSSPDANATTKYINVTAEHFGNITYTNGTQWGSSFAQANGISDGQTMIYENCKWIAHETSPFYTHENKDYKNPVHLVFKKCSMLTFANNNIYDKGIYLGDIGSNQKAILDIIGCNFYSFNANRYGNIRGLETSRLGDNIKMGGCNLHGYGNGKMCVNQSTIETLIFETTNNNSSVKVVGGTAYDVLWGEDFKVYSGTSNAHGLAIGSRKIYDKQSWWGSNATNVYSMAARLGNCAKSPKTLIIDVDGEEHTITFNKNYMTSDDSEYTIYTTPAIHEGIILTDMNQIMESWGVKCYNQYKGVYKYFEDEESNCFNNGNEAIMPFDMLIRKGANWEKATSETYDRVEGFAEERINPNEHGRVCLVKNCFIVQSEKPIGTLLTVDDDAHLSVTQDTSKAIFEYVDKNVITFVK